MLPYVFSTTPVGQTIRRLRKERGLTQEELAEQLGVTAQAVSKWENETGMPDISQIVPLAGVFGVSTDVIFGLDTTTAGEDVAKILRDAEADKVRGGAASYIKAYDRISEGLRKYPCDQRLLMNGFTLGMSLCMPDSGFYSAERAEEIAARSGSSDPDPTDCQKNNRINNPPLIFMVSGGTSFNCGQPGISSSTVSSNATGYFSFICELNSVNFPDIIESATSDCHWSRPSPTKYITWYP